MSGMSLKKEAREAQRKAKAQRKQEKRNARKRTADKDIPEPGATESTSPLQTQEGAALSD